MKETQTMSNKQPVFWKTRLVHEGDQPKTILFPVQGTPKEQTNKNLKGGESI